jgi:hypothetical protein
MSAPEDDVAMVMAAQEDEMGVRKFKAADLQDMIRCGICRGYIWDAFTITECLHTFCKGCIFKYTHDHSACASCGQALVGKPTKCILPDPTINDIVRSLIPDLKEKELAVRRAWYEARGLSLSEGSATSAPTAQRSDAAGTPRQGRQRRRLVCFKIEPIDGCGLPALTLPHLRTPVRMEMSVLKKYIAIKLKADKDVELKPAELEVLCGGVPCGSAHSLEFILRTAWKRETGPLVLHFRRAIKVLPGLA